MAPDKKPTVLGRIRHIAPWAIGVAIIVVMARRIPYAAFSTAVKTGPKLTLALFAIVQTVSGAFADTFATAVAMGALRVRRKLGDLFVIRATTYLLALINYGLGQGGIGYYLYRTGTPAVRATATVLFIMGINLAVLTLIAGSGILLAGSASVGPALLWTVGVTTTGLVIYLILIQVRPRILDRGVLGPLFETGLIGHAAAAAARLPHVAWFVIVNWAAMRIWGIPVPLSQALMFMPAVGLASALPISPAGLGTTQAAQVFFFSAWAAGATDKDRAANLLAFAVVYYVFALLATVVQGVVLLPAARRAQAVKAPAEPTPAPA